MTVKYRFLTSFSFLLFLSCFFNAVALSDDQMRQAVVIANTPIKRENLRAHIDRNHLTTIDPKTLQLKPRTDHSYFEQVDMRIISPLIDHAILQATMSPKPATVRFTHLPSRNSIWIDYDFLTPPAGCAYLGIDTAASTNTNKLRITMKDDGSFFFTAHPKQ